MNQTAQVLCAMILLCPLATSALAQDASSLKPIALDGAWRFQLDREDKGVTGKWFSQSLPDRITLPGILTAQGYGDVPSFETKWTGDGWRYPKLFVEYQSPENFKFPFFLQPPRHYVGAAWYQRDIDIPEAWQDRRIVLHLERVHWQAALWVGQTKVGTTDSLGTPHEFDLGTKLKPGRHTLTLRIDNRLDPVNVGPLSHSVTDHTQGNWNGAVGRIELRATEPAYLDDIRIYPDVAQKRVRIEIEAIGAANGKITARARYAGPLRDAWESAPAETEVANTNAVLTVDLGDNARAWDEFNPHLYLLDVSLESPAGREKRTIRFGLRQVGTRDNRITINGRKTFLRGTLECAIFPLTGAPPTDVDNWRRIIRICKAHGLNHIRFHSWCPPQAAFEAADELGFYFQVECSSWANQGAQIGSGKPLDAWILAESQRMTRAYGNHPSFMLMAYGNEPAGPNHKEWLEQFVAQWKKKDPRRLYTTGAGWPVRPGSDYHNPPDPRIQAWGGGLDSLINAKPPTTDFDWSGFVEKHPDAPSISHEIGQWCVYPNYDEIAKYTGYFKARNFEIFREQADKNGILPQARDMLMASGKLQALAYKHDIEAALRTPRFGGFQLLDLHDFSGQGTALVGVLDAFWDSKGYISAEEFRRFSGPVVPLARMKKLVLTTAETLEARIQLAQFGPADLKAVAMTWRLVGADRAIIAQGTLPSRDLPTGDLYDLGSIQAPLDRINAPARLRLEVGAAGHSFANHWDLFVYPAKTDAQPPANVHVTNLLDDAARQKLAQGGRVLLLANPQLIKPDPVHGQVKLGFSPIFWNTAWTQWQPPHTLGILCDPAHPALAAFPTESHSNWQWWDVVNGGTPFILTDLREIKPVVQVIDDWFTNRKLGLVFEASVGGGRLIACSANLSGNLDDRPAARQFLRSLLDYAGSEAFAPKATLTLEQVQGLLLEPTAMQKLGARIARVSSEQSGHGAAAILDNNPRTLWHTAWGDNAAKFPHEVVIEFTMPAPLHGLKLLPRQDKNINGWIREYVVHASVDGKNWGDAIARGSLSQDAKPKEIRFDQPVSTRFLKLVALSGFNADPFASLAELDVIIDAASPK